MSLDLATIDMLSGRGPRTRGDEPAAAAPAFRGERWSPHARARPPVKTCVVPARAGMSRSPWRAALGRMQEAALEAARAALGRMQEAALEAARTVARLKAVL